MQLVIIVITQLAPAALGGTASVLLGFDDVASLGIIVWIQLVFTGGSLSAAFVRRLLRRRGWFSLWIDVPLKVVAPAIAALPLISSAIIAGGSVALMILFVTTVFHGFAAVRLDRWSKS